MKDKKADVIASRCRRRDNLQIAVEVAASGEALLAMTE